LLKNEKSTSDGERLFQTFITRLPKMLQLYYSHNVFCTTYSRGPYSMKFIEDKFVCVFILVATNSS